jgi:hypothetical protein
MARSLLRTLRLRWSALVLALGLLLTSLPGTTAQTDVVYFPQTGHYLGGAFRFFWESNGGLLNFGYPITPEYTAENGQLIQYFERARFQLAFAEDGTAVVQLGKLGVEATQGRVFPKVPPIENTEDRRYIPETGHIIQYGFKTIWETRGAERIFGYPISEEIKEVLEDGQWHTVQYFENARFEYWPEFPPGQRVLVSNLGRRLAPPELTAPQPPPGESAPPPAPVAPPPLPPVPASVNASVIPEVGPPGTVFQFDAFGFAAGENVGIWITAPDQSTFGVDFQVEADGEGSIAREDIFLATDPSFPDGVWAFNARGVDSDREAIGYFRISRSGAALPAGDPARLGIVAHDGLPREGEAFIVPIAAAPGTGFGMTAPGFSPSESASAWISNTANEAFPIPASNVFVDENGEAFVEFGTAGRSLGTYNAVMQGQSSDRLAAAGFKLTTDYVAGPTTPLPPDVNGQTTPRQGPVGTTFLFRGTGFAPNEALEFWLTDPSGTYVLFPGTVGSDAQGRIGYDPPLDLTVTDDALAGVYGLHFRSLASGARVEFYFKVLPSTAATPQPGAGLRMLQHWQATGLIQSQNGVDLRAWR